MRDSVLGWQRAREIFYTGWRWMNGVATACPVHLLNISLSKRNFHFCVSTEEWRKDGREVVLEGLKVREITLRKYDDPEYGFKWESDRGEEDHGTWLKKPRKERF